MSSVKTPLLTKVKDQVKTDSVLKTNLLKLTLMEWFVGLGLATVSIGLTIFTAVLVKCFEATHDLPTNLVIIRGVLQIILFAVAVAQGDQFILPPTRREKLLVIVRGFFTGFVFMTNIAALRFLPLGDVFTIFTTRSVFCILIPVLTVFCSSKRFGKPIDANKLCLVLVASLGLYLFLSSRFGEVELTEDLMSTDSSADRGDVVLPELAFLLEKPQSYNTVQIGIAMAFLNLVLSMPIVCLEKMIEGTSASIQSFWSGVGGFLIGVVASFFDSTTSIFSGYYSAYEFYMMLVISICFIMIAVLQSQAIKLISSPALNIILLVQIPVAFVVCPNEAEVMPDFYTMMGMLFILSSSMVGDWILHLEEKQGARELSSDPYVEI
eukprot:GFUD01024059.1.p1 GENE.GFUD01024059.1~~GFUD01024059.1.p1  ORF type:complete len:380 (-),score=55.19 GFUD01024059.1:148-1287(-)